MANAHKRSNFLAKIKMHGKWLTGDRELKEGVVGAFKTLLFEDRARGLELMLYPLRCWKIERPGN